jgi:hypothetical protein
MSVLPVGFGASASTAFQIDNSLRFRASNSAYLSRTFGTPTNNTTWTYSCWIKRGKLGQTSALLGHESGFGSIGIESTDQIRFWNNAGSTAATSTPVYRDPSAHGHFFVRSNGTDIKAYWNSVEVLSYTGTITNINSSGTAHAICKFGGYYNDCLLSEINFIDGQALTPSDFGETNADGVWVPKAYTGSYGNNGFHLDFSDATSTTTLGYDAAGSNDWTCNNISLTAGVTYDHMTDTPTNNFATLNPLLPVTSMALSAGNLTATSSGANKVASATIGMASGKWYWEEAITTYSSDTHVGLLNALTTTSLGTYVGGSANGFSWSGDIGDLYTNGAAYDAAFNTTFTTNDVLGVAFDADAGKLWFAKNGTWLKSSDPATATSPHWTGLTSGPYWPALSTGSSGVVNSNFGQRPFTYTPPTGFKALCTANLPTVAITNPREHFDTAIFAMGAVDKTVTVDGNGNNLALQPDLIWHKARNNSQNHYLVDSVRGGSSLLRSNTTDAESTGSTFISAFSSPGYTATTALLTNTYTYAAWLWKANGAGVSNTAGSITSTVSANTTAGFSIVTYTGTGANATVGHGLGVAPKLIIIKQRSSGTTENWAVYNANLANTEYLLLNSTNAKATGATYWNSTTPTTTVFSIGSAADTNESTKDFVAYCFAEIPGYSKFGSYTGNGSTDGPFVFCGFRPRYVLIKRIDTATEWWCFDTARDTYNVAGLRLAPSSNTTEGSGTSLDFVANGIKFRDTNAAWNASGGTYIFAAFAEHPFGGSNVSPSPAR